jgi:hypothetical protein
LERLNDDFPRSIRNCRTHFATRNTNLGQDCDIPSFKEYRAIVKEAGYDDCYIREAGAELWQSLSEVLQEPVKKRNFCSLLKQKFSKQTTIPNVNEQMVWRS